jgi:probable rRNA maturation factor
MAVTVKSNVRYAAAARVLKKYAVKAARFLNRADDDLAIIVVTPAAIKKINAVYRKKNVATDILSFPAEIKGDLGDIFIAPAIALKKAKQRQMPFSDYLKLLAAHGVLHLGGFDHVKNADAKRMGRAEEKILK